MNEMYYNDYFNNECLLNSYPMNNSQDCRNSSLDYSSFDSMYSSSSSDRIDTFFNPVEGFSKGNMQANIYKPYKLTNPTLPPVYNERQRLLLDVQKYGFAMWDLNLYLNTHPTDRNAMMIFDKYRNLYKRAVDDYQNRYGDLSVTDASINSGYWSWNKCPWPWEGE